MNYELMYMLLSAKLILKKFYFFKPKPKPKEKERGS